MKHLSVCAKNCESEPEFYWYFAFTQEGGKTGEKTVKGTVHPILSSFTEDI